MPQAPITPSLPEVHGTIPVSGSSLWKRFLAITGPGYMVSVGYMDPGNWATDMAGGSLYGYQLLWVILLSNVMAILLQTLCVRLGLVTGHDLAQACRAYYPRPLTLALWLLCELAIIACDLAEVIGSAIALHLLFGIPLVLGVLLTGLDVLLLLGLMTFGFRKLEAVVVTLVATIAICFGVEIIWASPDWGGVARGLFTPQFADSQALYISLGILGATVMPHNLYLHSALVQTRVTSREPDQLADTIRLNTIDTVIALMAAFFVNAAILILSAAVFHRAGVHPEELQDAHQLLTPMLGGAASTLFAVALLASGQSSTITGTLAGQIVMEGFLNLRIRPWLRRVISRALAIIPAVVMIVASGGKETVKMLLISQVVLSLQLPFAIFPLLFFTSDPGKMGRFANPLWVKLVGFACCTLIATLNVLLLARELGWTVVAVGAVALTVFFLWAGRQGPQRQEAPQVAGPL